MQLSPHLSQSRTAGEARIASNACQTCCCRKTTCCNFQLLTMQRWDIIKTRRIATIGYFFKITSRAELLGKVGKTHGGEGGPKHSTLQFLSIC